MDRILLKLQPGVQVPAGPSQTDRHVVTRVRLVQTTPPHPDSSPGETPVSACVTAQHLEGLPEDVTQGGRDRNQVSWQAGTLGLAGAAWI